MELRNKTTGKRGVLALNNNEGEIEIVVLEPDMPLCGNSVLARYDSLAELNEEWEDYTPKEPLIKDEKVRNLARGWAELCCVEPQDKLHCCTGHGCSFIQVPASDCQLSIYGTQHGIPEDGDYTITELCGEEE